MSGHTGTRGTRYTRHGGTTYQYESFRDVAHTDLRVRQDIVRYLRMLQSAGYRGWQVEQAYAHVLTHPGLPTVFWKHYFDWGTDLRMKIAALINARKVAGVHAGSALFLQDNARQAGVYAARVDGRNGELYVRVGGSDAHWEPGKSNYSGFREYAQGAGWKVWVKVPGNPEVQQAGRRGALPVPVFRKAEEMEIGDVR